jgi:hypothetical protein
LTPQQEQLLETLCESEDFLALLREIRESEMKLLRKHIGQFLKNGDLSKACIAQGSYQVWESELSQAFLRRLTKIRDQQKGTARPPRGE